MTEEKHFLHECPVSNPNETHYVTKGKEKGAKEEAGDTGKRERKGERGRQGFVCVCEYEIQYNEIHYCVYIMCNDKSKMLQKHNLI